MSRPNNDLIYDCVRIYLIRRAIFEIRQPLCPGCKEPYQPSQLEHMVGGGYGCIDPLDNLDDSLYDAAQETIWGQDMHRLASTIRRDYGNSKAQDCYRLLSDDALKDVVTDRVEWNYDERYDLGEKVSTLLDK